MSPHIIFSLSYVPFVIFIAMSCLYKGRAEKILKTLSAVCGTIAMVFYIIFIKNLL
jgi:hypothetical protein